MINLNELIFAAIGHNGEIVGGCEGEFIGNYKDVIEHEIKCWQKESFVVAIKKVKIVIED